MKSKNTSKGALYTKRFWVSFLLKNPTEGSGDVHPQQSFCFLKGMTQQNSGEKILYVSRNHQIQPKALRILLQNYQANEQCMNMWFCASRLCTKDTSLGNGEEWHLALKDIFSADGSKRNFP